MVSIRMKRLFSVLLLITLLSCQRGLGEGEISLVFKPIEGENVSLFLSGPKDSIRIVVEVSGVIDSPHSEMEKQMKAFLESKGMRFSDGGCNLLSVEYMKEALTGLEVTASTSLFGQAEGSDLSGFFALTKLNPDTFLFSWERKLLGLFPEERMSLNTFLTGHFLALPHFALTADGQDSNLLDETIFTVRIHLGDDKVLVGTTK